MWFAFKIVPLVYEIQRSALPVAVATGCDLLSKLYLWYMKYNESDKNPTDVYVVICFQNCTFGIWNTTNSGENSSKGSLWFAFKIVPLVYEIQLGTS